MNPETILQAKIRAAVNALPWCRFWRNSVGFDDGHKIKYGLAKGSSDLIGMVQMTAGVGRFVGLEVKTPTGRMEPEQVIFRDTVNKFGGRAYVVRSVEDALAAVEDARR